MLSTRITKIFTFDSAHTLRYHDGKCRNLHGHTYKLEVTVGGEVQPVQGHSESGMILDFGELKRIVKEEVLDRLDHTDLDSTFDYTTAELMAMWIFFAIDERLVRRDGPAVIIHRIRLWETPTSYAEVVNE